MMLPDRTMTIFILDPNDVDSYMACEYTSYYLKDALTTIVVDGKPNNNYKDKLDNLVKHFQKQTALGISNTEIIDQVPIIKDYTVDIICCSGFTKVAEACNKIQFIRYIYGQGCYIRNMYDKNDPKYVKSPMLSRDLVATDSILSSRNKVIGMILLISENIVQSPHNRTSGFLWRNDDIAQYLFKKYNRRDYKHNVNHMFNIRYNITNGMSAPIDSYIRISDTTAIPECIKSEQGKYYWGTTFKETGYRLCNIAYLWD